VKEESMGKKSDALTPEELAAQQGEELPAREVMTAVAIEPVVDPTGPYSPDTTSTEPMPASNDPATTEAKAYEVPPHEPGPPQPVPPGDSDPQPVPPGTGGPDPYEQSVEPDGGPEVS
jgi:hypothetical protein